MIGHGGGRRFWPWGKMKEAAIRTREKLLWVPKKQRKNAQKCATGSQMKMKAEMETEMGRNNAENSKEKNGVAAVAEKLHPVKETVDSPQRILGRTKSAG